MKNALIVASFLGISAFLAQLASCSSGTVSPDGGNGGGSGGSVSGGAGGTVSGGAGGSISGGAGGSPEGGGGGGGDSGMQTIPIVATTTGYVSPADNSTLGMVGAWYAFGDNWGTNGQPPGNCETVGKFPTTACSVITSPAPSVAPPDAGPEASVSGFPSTATNEFCLSGYAAKVIDNEAGMPDYSDIFGIGFGVNFKDPNGMVMPYNAMTNNIVGFSFNITGTAAVGGVRVSVPMVTDTPADEPYNTAIMTDGPTTILFSQLVVTTYTAPAGNPTFDPTMIQNIQWQIISNTTATNPPGEPDAGPATVCISNLAAVIQ